MPLSFLRQPQRFFRFLALVFATNIIAFATGAAGQSSWTIETVDTGVWVIDGNAIALTSNDEPRIAYWDRNTLNIKYAARSGAGWTIEVVENTGNWGSYLELALNAADEPHISYFSNDVQGLKLARRIGGIWTTEIVDNSGRPGSFSSIAIASDGLPRISYYDDSSAGLRYAESMGGSWNIEQVPSGGGPTYLALDSDDNPRISYALGNQSGVRLASRDNGAWVVDVVDQSPRFYGDAPMALDQQENPHIAYLDRGSLEAHYVRRLGGQWQSEAVAVGDAFGRSAFALDSQDQPRFLSRLPSEWSLTYVAKDGGAWTTTVVAPVGNGGGVSDLAMSSTDRAHVMYYDASTMSLMYAFQTEPCTPSHVAWQDNFEDGDDIGWDQIQGVWSVVDGTYRGMDPADGRSVAGNSWWTDYSYEGRFLFDPASAYEATILVRVNDARPGTNLGHYYQIANYVTLDQVRLHRIDDGLVETVNAPWTFEPGVWYHFRVDVCGSSIRYFIDDILLLSYESPAVYPSGKIGVKAYASSVWFDDLLVRTAAPQTWTVPGDAATIQAAVNLAASGDTVNVLPGTYSGPGNKNIDYGGKTVVVQATAGAASTIIDVQASSVDRARAFDFNDGEPASAVVDGFTIMNGWEGQGGAIRIVNGARPTIRNCTFIYNTADASDNGGGAIFCELTSPLIQDCVFESNSAVSPALYGGAISSFLGGDAVIERCSFTGNSAMRGPAINMNSGTVRSCVFVGNGSGNESGALRIWGSAAVEDCVFRGNTANLGDADGGAIWLHPTGNTTISGSVFLSNSSIRRGGAILVFGRENNAAVQVTSCTFQGNSTAGLGSAMWLGMYFSTPSVVSVDRTIISLGGPRDPIACEGTAAASLTCCDVTGHGNGNWIGCLAGQGGTNGNFSVDPEFCAPADRLTLLDTSPCLPGNHPYGADCGLIGALDQDCIAPLTAVSPVDLSDITLQVRPTISQGEMTLMYALPTGQGGVIDIFDVTGRRVWTKTVKGVGVTVWNQSDSGTRVASGQYFIRLTSSNGNQMTARATVVR